MYSESEIAQHIFCGEKQRWVCRGGWRFKERKTGKRKDERKGGEEERKDVKRKGRKNRRNYTVWRGKG